MGRRRAILASALWLTATSAAHAQSSAAPTPAQPPPEPLAEHLVQPYRVIIGLERVLMLSPYTQTGAHDSGGLSLGLGPYLRTLDTDAARPFLPQLAPRLCVDLLFEEPITIGAGFGFGLSASELDLQGSYDQDDTATRTSTTAVLQWRLGYLAPVGDTRTAAFWPRVGLSHAWGSGEIPERPYVPERVETWAHNTQANVDLSFVFVAARHFGLTLTFHVDFGVDGTSGGVEYRDWLGEQEETEAQRLHDAFGVSLGVLSYL